MEGKGNKDKQIQYSSFVSLFVPTFVCIYRSSGRLQVLLESLKKSIESLSNQGAYRSEELRYHALAKSQTERCC